VNPQALHGLSACPARPEPDLSNRKEKKKNCTISTTATQADVLIISRRDLAAAITLSMFSRVAKSDVEIIPIVR